MFPSRPSPPHPPHPQKGKRKRTRDRGRRKGRGREEEREEKGGGNKQKKGESGKGKEWSEELGVILSVVLLILGPSEAPKIGFLDALGPRWVGSEYVAAP